MHASKAERHPVLIDQYPYCLDAAGSANGSTFNHEMLDRVLNKHQQPRTGGTACRVNALLLAAGCQHYHQSW
jgi:hypothetical protein